MNQEKSLSPYKDHLQIDKRDAFFPMPFPEPIRPPVIPNPNLKTNFGYTLTNQYAFLLVHLKKVAASKNILGINIPEICIFSNGVPLEMLYSEAGEIRSLKGKQSIRLSQIYTFFKNRGQRRTTNRQEHSLACFEDNDCLMLSDTDLFICCRKFRNDPFFLKLQYLRNKIGSPTDPIEVLYSAEADCMYAGEAMSGLLGKADDQKMLRKGQQVYLRYLNSKVAMYLNFENNIRLISARFFYNRTPEGQYYLINICNMVFDNLTFAIRQRQRRLKLKQEERNKILIMSPEKQANEGVKSLESIMNDQWQILASQVRIKTNQERKKEEARNQQAFKKLFPNLTIGLQELTTQKNFRMTRKKMLKLDERKSIVERKHSRIKYSQPLHRRYKTEPTFA